MELGANRVSLAVFVGKRVNIKGVIEGYPKKHKKTGMKMDLKKFRYPKYRKNTVPPASIPFDGPVSPIRFPENATCIKNVVGIDGFEIIHEDHINIQEDLMELWQMKKGDEIRLSGVVTKYKKKTHYEYCLVDVERIN